VFSLSNKSENMKGVSIRYSAKLVRYKQKMTDVGFEVYTPAEIKSVISWNVVACNSMKVTTTALEVCFMLDSSLVHTANLWMEMMCPFGTSVDIQLTARHYITEDINIQKLI
jgi:hypothetical protein